MPFDSAEMMMTTTMMWHKMDEIKWILRQFTPIINTIFWIWDRLVFFFRSIRLAVSKQTIFPSIFVVVVQIRCLLFQTISAYSFLLFHYFHLSNSVFSFFLFFNFHVSCFWFFDTNSGCHHIKNNFGWIENCDRVCDTHTHAWCVLLIQKYLWPTWDVFVRSIVLHRKQRVEDFDVWAHFVIKFNVLFENNKEKENETTKSVE